MANGHVNVPLDHEHVEKLARLAERAQASQDSLAGSLLSSALDNADVDPERMTEILDGIPGAFERAELGREQYERGEFIELDQL